jgi:hypothetical protein
MSQVIQKKADEVGQMPGTSQDICDPLTPVACNLKAFPILPFHLKAIQGSKTWLKAKRNPQIAFYYFNLVIAAWHEVPAASLPNDQSALASLALCDEQTWPLVKDAVMHDWVTCSDGRLYLPWLAERACRAWDGHLRLMNRLPRVYEVSAAEWDALRLSTFARDNYTCIYCQDSGVPLEADHLIPYSKGGLTVLENLGTACTPCNRSKGNKTDEEFRNARR